MIQINRQVEPGKYKLSDIFPDIRQNPILLEIFTTSTEIDDVLSNTLVIVSDKPRYMKVDNEDGSILIGRRHLELSDVAILYLDIIHELVHVKQHRQGIDLYDRSKAYVDRQTEIDAYEFAIGEARRIGFTAKQILDYLCVEWITPEEHQRLAKRLKIVG
ncbi:hypothetical protein ACFL0M_00680 [Thermodesulfobacteriota bacterium]